MRHVSSSPVLILEKFVKEFRKKYPRTHTQEIDEVLQRYRLQNGNLKNDDNIMLDLRDLAKKWKRRKPRLTSRRQRR